MNPVLPATEIQQRSTSSQENILAIASTFSEKKLRPFAREFDVNEQLPKAIIEEMGSLGFLGASFPKKYGGLELGASDYGALTEIIGKGDSSARALLTVHTSLVGEAILKCGSAKLKEKWLPQMAQGQKIGCFALTEPEVGTDAKSIQTSYTKKGDFFLLNGKKKWITFSGLADFYLVIARNSAQEKTLSAFIVEKGFEGISVEPMKGLLASRAAHISCLSFNNVKIPAANLLGKEGTGFTYVVNAALDHGRFSIAWGGLAIAQAALEEMVSYARKRSQFGQKIYNFQLIQGMIGNAVTKVHAGRALCMRAAKLREENHPDLVMETNIAKYYTSKIAMEVSTDAVQVHGGNGCYNEYPVERLFREAKILEIIEGTSQIQQNIIALYGLKNYFRP